MNPDQEKVVLGHRPTKLVVISGIMSFLFVASFAAALVPVAHASTTVNVTIKNYTFTPSTITVVIGVNNTVTWTNEDTVNHAPTANDGSWGGTTGAEGGTYTHTFTVAGTFPYHCAIHPTMTGTVIVLGTGSASSTTTSSSATTVATTTTAATTPATTTTTTSVPASSTTSGGVPEFPYGSLSVALVAVMIAASYVYVRRRQMSIRPP